MRKNFLPVRKSPFTNTSKSPLFCMRKVNISQFLMESLHYGEMLGGYYINSGFYWGSTTGIYYDILGRVCDRLAAGRGLLDIKICMPTRQGIVCGRLKASRSRRRVTACTARRRGVPFTRVKGTKTRLGLCPKTP